MNGQPGRRQLVRDIAAAVKIDAVIETGTFRGTTTSFLWDVTGAPVSTAEANPRFAAFARWRFRDIPDVSVYTSDSRAFLSRLAADPSVPKWRTFFYLDAHWGADLPLRDELETVLSAWSEPIIMIDDFEVPGDSGYGFDDYGPGRRLTLRYLPRAAMDGYEALFPVLPSAQEEGERRGCAVITSDELAREFAAKGVPLRGGSDGRSGLPVPDPFASES